MKKSASESSMFDALEALGARADGAIALFDSFEDTLFWIKDRQGRFCWVNTAFLIFHGGRRRKDIIGKTDFDLAEANFATQYRIDDERVHQGVSINSRVELNVFNKTARWFVTSKIPLRDDKDRIVATAGMTRLLPREGEKVLGNSPLSPAMELISSHYDEHITIKQMAAACGQSVGVFSRTFRATYQSSPHAYLRQLRIRLSCNALAFTDQPLAVIAENHGFFDQSHFTREFRRQMKDTPKAYRARHRR